MNLCFKIEEEEEEMGILCDDMVIIRPSEKEGEPRVVTVNCPDKTGLGCDLCRIILSLGLNIVRVGKLSPAFLVFLERKKKPRFRFWFPSPFVSFSYRPNTGIMGYAVFLSSFVGLSSLVLCFVSLKTQENYGK